MTTTLRTNWAHNPGFSYGSTGWAPSEGLTFAVSSDPAPWAGAERQGPQYAALTVSGTVAQTWVESSPVPVAAGEAVAVSALVRPGQGVVVAAVPRFLTAAGAEIPTWAPRLAATRTGRPTWAATVPQGAARMAVRLALLPAPGARALRVGARADVDEVLITRAPTADQALADAAAGYFDGDTPARRVGSTAQIRAHAWQGQPGSSPSTEALEALTPTTMTAVVETGTAPRVQIIIPAGQIPAGDDYRVVGTARGQEWPVPGGRGTSTGEQVLLADALAPINIPVSYEARCSGGAVLRTTPITRPWPGRTLVSDLTATRTVDCLWQGDDSRTLAPRLTAHDVAGRPTPVVVYAPAQGQGDASAQIRTTGEHTSALQGLLLTPTPIALLHNPRWCIRCQRGACDVPLVTVLAVTSASHALAARLDAAERVWQIKGTITGLPEAGTALSVSSWNDFDGVGLTWTRFDDRADTWDGFDRTIWQEVPR